MASASSRRVLPAHRAPARTPIRVRPGERVDVGAHDVEWPDFVWATQAGGAGGWVPQDVLARHGDQAIVQAESATAELEADPGDHLQLLREHAGGGWARDEHAREGWMPARCLATDAHTPAATPHIAFAATMAPAPSSDTDPA